MGKPLYADEIFNHSGHISFYRDKSTNEIHMVCSKSQKGYTQFIKDHSDFEILPFGMSLSDFGITAFILSEEKSAEKVTVDWTPIQKE